MTFAANQIMAIKPYKWNGLWVFDDEGVGLVREPFIAGADELIDLAIEEFGIADADRGFLLIFSGGPFPTAQAELTWVRSDNASGNYYQWEGHEGWLCPALLKYFPTAPRKIFAEFRTIRD